MNAKTAHSEFVNNVEREAASQQTNAQVACEHVCTGECFALREWSTSFIIYGKETQIGLVDVVRCGICCAAT